MTISHISQRKLPGSSFSISSSSFFFFWPIEREELVNFLSGGICRRECATSTSGVVGVVGLKICVEDVKDSFTDNPWVVAWTFEDEFEGCPSRINHDWWPVTVETNIDQVSN